MKTYGLAPFAVILLWLGLSAVWIGQTRAPWAFGAEAPGSAAAAMPVKVAGPFGPVMIELSWRPPLGPIMTDLVSAPVSGIAAVVPPDVEPTAQSDETMIRLHNLESQLSIAMAALERVSGNASPDQSVTATDLFPGATETLLASAPITGFAIMLLLALLVATGGGQRGRAIAGRLRTRIHRITAPVSGGEQEGTGSSDIGASGGRAIYGQAITHVLANGQLLQAGVFDENQVRAAAGLTLALGAVAFGYAALGKVYLPIQTVTALFFVEFLIRVSWGITHSPLGLLAGWMVRRTKPIWVSAKPKRFAWSLGLVLSFAMMLITNTGIRGPLPLTICLICLTLMWLETALGLCLGCEIHRHLVRLGWVQADKDFEICSNGACTYPTKPAFKQVTQ